MTGMMMDIIRNCRYKTLMGSGYSVLPIMVLIGFQWWHSTPPTFHSSTSLRASSASCAFEMDLDRKRNSWGILFFSSV